VTSVHYPNLQNTPAHPRHFTSKGTPGLPTDAKVIIAEQIINKGVAAADMDELERLVSLIPPPFPASRGNKGSWLTRCV
jgi:hypothetical protein